MGLFSTKQPTNRQTKRTPTERGPLNEVCVGELWVSDSGRKNFSLSRVNPQDAAKPFRTFRAQDLGFCVEALMTLSSAFAHDPSLTPELQAELGHLSTELESVVEKAKLGFVVKENGEAKTASFLGAAA